MSGILYLVATPIGNLGDITYRAVEILKNVDLIACEDTRHSSVLLNHYGIHKPLMSYHDFSERQKAPRLAEEMKNGKTIALISDAGTPGIADPGYRLVKAAIENNIKVEAIPGPSAVLTALSLSGLPTDRFVFEGFLPVKSGAREKKLLSLKEEDRTVIFYESPHRILKSLKAIEKTLGEITVVVARELTKKFEEIFRGTAAEAHKYFSQKKIRGEFVILLSSSLVIPSPLAGGKLREESS
ncbi:MAG: 16S rRNA (cytidine(1402)-2'-O)-methyltransferase, partial [Candidatus Omnitrophica bacterium]|nr:16S rRNA (cytidine(1402)-2'-O)-methyltransferase [Candidatus Omnitrophota bacterium]